MKRLYTLPILLCSVLLVWAGIDEEARLMLENGDYPGAVKLARNALADNPKASVASSLNLTAGISLFYMHDYAESRTYLEKAKAKGVPEAYLYLGRIAFMNYDFEGATALYSRYSQLQRKARKSIDSELDADMRRVEAATSFMDRVEKIAIIDSIAVDRKDFFKAYRISPESGSLNDGSEFPISQDSVPEYFYANEGYDYILWSQTDSSGHEQLMESMRLTDGTWHTPMPLDSKLNDGGDAVFPFMLSDGVTLYFANNGENSMGGYDIFVSNRDAEDGTYMTPQNMGMPYNSPYDDYLLAIDELTGTGWWATDRNCLDNDMITIYVFIPNDLRSNYDADDENLTDFARISDYKSTWEFGKDKFYSEILEEIRNIDLSLKRKNIDFTFPIGKGVIYENLDDFRTSQGHQMMRQYIDDSKEFEGMLEELSNLRKEYYASNSSALVAKISALERATDGKRESLQRLRSEIIRVEKEGK